MDLSSVNIVKNEPMQLCAVTEDYLEIIEKWFASRELMKMNGIPFILLSKDYLKAEIISRRNLSKDPNLILKVGNQEIGLIIHEVAKPMMTGKCISLLIFSENNFESLYLKGLIGYLEYAFMCMRCLRVTLYMSQIILSGNPKLDLKMEEIGFYKEGVLKEERYIEGKYVDTCIWGIKQEDFRCDC